MSPLFDNRFKGHMETGDPRSLIFAAAGCTWPTVPAWRYRAVSCDATMLFAGLNVPGLLLLLDVGGVTHDSAVWITAAPVPPIFVAALVKTADTVNPGGSLWRFFISIAGIPGTIEKIVTRPEARCNQPLLLGAFGSDIPAQGTTGDTFRLEQVEWDEEFAPDSTRLECT